MTPEEFRGFVNSQNDSAILGLCLGEDMIPYVFEPEPDKWNTFRDFVSAELGVARNDIRIVGSGRLGFSMKPRMKLKSFSDKSDIDVVIVNSAMFDWLWLALLRAAYPRFPLTQTLGGWLRKRRNEIYTGWLTPLEIRLDLTIHGAKAKPVVEFNARWFNTLKLASQIPPRRHEDVSGRLYRSWEHAELYHLQSLAALRRSLTE